MIRTKGKVVSIVQSIKQQKHEHSRAILHGRGDVGMGVSFTSKGHRALSRSPPEASDGIDNDVELEGPFTSKRRRAIESDSDFSVCSEHDYECTCGNE